MTRTDFQILIDRSIAIAQLSALGYKTGDKIYLRFFYPEGDPRKAEDSGVKRECSFPNLPWDFITRLQDDGRGCYFVVNGGGHNDASVKMGRAIFYEHDDLEKAVSRDLWQQLNLPEPTIQVDTGGKSIHSFWRVDCTVEQFRELQADLLEYSDGDRKIKNPSRVMRLAGAYHIKPSREPIQSAIVSNSSKVYTFEALRTIIPRQHPESAKTESWAHFEKNLRLPISEPIPLVECLSKANRILIEQGVGEGQRNDRGYALACDLVGTSNYLDSIRQFYDGDPKALFENYCNHCSPSLENVEAESIWRSAQKRSTSSSLSATQIENCIKGWVWRQKRAQNISSSWELHNNRPEPVNDGSGQRSSESTFFLSFEEAMQQLNEISQAFGMGTARWKWEIGVLAKEVKRSRTELLEIYQDKQSETEPFAPIDVTEFLNTDYPDREWLIAGHISLASTIGLIADGGVGKTLLIYDLCKAIATGNPWNGFKSKRSKVLIIQTDEPEVDTRERLNIAGFQDLEAGWIFIETSWQFSKVRQLEAWIEQHFAGESGFVVIDSMSSANRSTQAEEKDSSYAAPLYGLRDIANRRNVTFVVLHHTNKMGGVRGTTAFRNNLSEVWVLRKGEPKDNLKPTQRILEIEKSRAGCNGIFQIQLNVDDYSWDYQGDFGLDETAPIPLKAKILNWLELNRGTKYEPEELLEVSTIGTSSTKEAIRKQLERMKRQAIVDCEDRVRQTQFGTRRYKVYFLPNSSSASGQTSEQAFEQLKQHECPEADENRLTLYSSSSERSGQASGQQGSGQVQSEIPFIKLSSISSDDDSDSSDKENDDWADPQSIPAPAIEDSGQEIAIGDKVLAYYFGQWEQAIVLGIPIAAPNGKSIRSWKVHLTNGQEVHIWEREHLALCEAVKNQSGQSERTNREIGDCNNHSP